MGSDTRIDYKLGTFFWKKSSTNLDAMDGGDM
jgi:hypothetical protein